jgi:hypothetical protein
MEQPEKLPELSKKQLRKKRKKEMDDYWNSPQHQAASYGAALFLILSAINFIDQGWVQAAISGYIVGLIVYYIYHTGEYFRHKSGELKSPLEVISEVLAEPKRAENPAIESSSPQPEHSSEKLMAQFNELYQRTSLQLPALAQEKLQDIHDLLTLMTQKMARQDNLDSQIEMLKIQRIVNQYITPLLEHYTDLPPFLQDRSQNNELSPNDMLIQQLNLIHEEVLKTTEHVFQNNIEALSVHGDFLKQKLTPHEFFKVEKES